MFTDKELNTTIMSVDIEIEAEPGKILSALIDTVR